MVFGAIYIPNFILQAIGRGEPELRTQPLALLDGAPPTYQVVASNRLAELQGVVPGMTKAALEQFKGVKIRFRSPAHEEAAHAALLDVGWSISPRIEDAAPDTLLLDLSGLQALFGGPEEIAARLASCAAEFGLEVHTAISANLQTARVVARALPGCTVVPEGQEARYLETLPVEMLCPSEELLEVFKRWGVTTCKSLASLPVLSLSECAGQEGVRLHAISSGKGLRALLVSRPTDRFEEWFELEDAVDDLEALSFLLGRLLDQLCARLSARSLALVSIQLHFELQPAFEGALDASQEFIRKKQLPGSFSCTLALPVPSRDAKLLLKLLRLRLQSKPPGSPIQKIHMIAEPSRARMTQGGLFAPAFPDPEKLELTIARIAAVVGEGNVGSPQPLDSHRPDAFRMQRFPAPAAAPARREQDGTQAGFRAFRPPVPATVECAGNQPAFAAFQGRSGKVVRASGPWRTSGEWWENHAWQEDAWDLEIHFAEETPASPGLYRLSYDSSREKWTVRGIYD